MQIITYLGDSKLSWIDTPMSATVNRSRKSRSSKPSYKMMIITAIASQTRSRRGVSRQMIASYLQQNYHVSSGGRFNAALRSALNSGIDSGIFKFGNTKQRFKLTDDGRKLNNKQTAKTNQRTARGTKTKKQKKNEIADTNTADKSTQCDIKLDQQDQAEDTERIDVLPEFNRSSARAKSGDCVQRIRVNLNQHGMIFYKLRNPMISRKIPIFVRLCKRRSRYCSLSTVFDLHVIVGHQSTLCALSEFPLSDFNITLFLSLNIHR